MPNRLSGFVDFGSPKYWVAKLKVKNLQKTAHDAAFIDFSKHHF